MQNQEVKVGFEIPVEDMEIAGLADSVVQVSIKRGKIVIRKATKKDFKKYVCDRDCENCPWYRQCGGEKK